MVQRSALYSLPSFLLLILGWASFSIFVLFFAGSYPVFAQSGVQSFQSGSLITSGISLPTTSASGVTNAATGLANTGATSTGSIFSGVVMTGGNTGTTMGSILSGATVFGGSGNATSGAIVSSGSGSIVSGNSISGNVVTGVGLTGNLSTGNALTGLTLGTSGSQLVTGSSQSGLFADDQDTITQTGVTLTGANEKKNTSPITYSGDMNMDIINSTFSQATVVLGEERTDLANGLQVYIPQDTQLLREDLTLYTGVFQAPEYVDTSRLLSQDVRTIIHIGSYEENLYFYNDTKSVDITIRVPIKGYANQEQFIIFTSQDGQEREYHDVGTIVVAAGEAYVEFMTSHLTFFSVGTANGDFYINGDVPTTYDPTVQLQTVLTGLVEMKFGNTETGRDASPWLPFASNYQWTLPGPGGLKTVYALFKDSLGNTGTVADTILLERLVRASRVENVSPSAWTTVVYQKEYNSVPVVIATPVTDNNGNNYPIPQVRNVTTTGFELKICVDAGQISCNLAANPEDIDVMVFDPDVAATLSWITVGTQTVATDGSTTSLNFGLKFSSTPYVWTTSQTQTQGPNISAIARVKNSNKKNTQLIGCVHPGIGDDCQTGFPSEIFGYVAIDPTMIDLVNARLGVATMASSTWTIINYPQGLTSPVFMATQNSDNGRQDPQYPWIRSSTINAAQVRFCEADGANYCDSHLNEDVAWAAFDRQDMPYFLVEFSTTSFTSGNVIATVTPSSGTTILNNNGSGVRTFFVNENFEYIYSDQYGFTGSFVVTVDWILDPLVENRLMYADVVFNVSSSTWTTIAFKKNYTEPPVVIATPVTTNAINTYPIAQVRNVTTTGFELKYCMDAAATTCDTGFGPEDFHYFVFDQTSARYFDWIEVGMIPTATNGSDTPHIFANTFANTPYVFVTSQTQSQGGNIAAIGWVDDITTNAMNLIGCVHQGAGNDCESGQPAETFGYVAIDVASMSITGAQYGNQFISSSTWTPVSFSPSYVEPVIMVTQNTDNGAEDPQYPWARNIVSNGAEIRYCEADGFNYCDSHAAENVVWFAIDRFVEPQISIAAPSVCSAVPREIEDLAFNLEHTCAGLFTLTDDTGLDDGYYTTLQISNLTGTYSTIINSDVMIVSSGLVLLSGAANPNVILAPGMTGYQSFGTPLVYIKRNIGANAGLTGTYGTELSLRTTIPSFSRPDVYHGVITYTLYDY